ncbi:MAG: protein-L-isoaspartate O-methyltransferase [Pseudorhodoplanes sp.]|nr:protein-L-isoaspartate O-methyltransferase [Pseudorhodoplanes sp.]
MSDFTTARRMMVDGQIRTNDVTDLRVISAFLEVPRERFVPASKAAIAYLDMDIPVSDDGTRCLLKPMVLAKLLQAADIGDADKVLIVGCATGYSAAIAAKLAASVLALEEDHALARQARRNLADLDVSNVDVVEGPLTAGWPAAAPYQVVLMDGSIEVLPPAFARQVASGGRLVTIEASGPAPKARLYVAGEGDLAGRPIFDAAAPRLPGFERAPAFVF